MHENGLAFEERLGQNGKERMNRFTDIDFNPTTYIQRQLGHRVGMLVSEAILRLGASALPDEEIRRRGKIMVHRHDPTSTFMWDDKPIVQWRLENWEIKWAWLPDAPPLIDL